VVWKTFLVTKKTDLVGLKIGEIEVEVSGTGGFKINENNEGQACDCAILQQYSARSARQHKAWGVNPRIDP
jgi:hypothetical protein